MGLARDVLADVVACQEILALAEVRGYVREAHGREEEVRPYEKALEGEAVHTHIGLPESLTDYSRNELSDYKYQGYQWLNPYLRAGSRAEASRRVVGLPPERAVERKLRLMDQAFRQAAPTSRPVTVYRGVRGFLPERITSGTVLRDGAYMSTTTDMRVARDFAGSDPSQKVVRITVPAGEKALSMGNLVAAGAVQGLDPEEADFDREREVLLPRGRSLRVTGVHGGIVDAELLPAETAPQPVAHPQATAPALSPAQQALAKAAAYRKTHPVAATMVLSRTASRASRFIWRPGDVQITRPPSPIS
jgi:ADP-ribosyltransferase exoenzyme